MAVKLNLGAGSTDIEGFHPLDAKMGHDVRHLEYEDESVDEIRASHILEHFSYREVSSVLGEWLRVLKMGGKIRLAVPDRDWIDAHPDDPGAEAFLMGGHADTLDVHKSTFNKARLSDIMKRSGLEEINEWESDHKDCSSLPVSLNLEGVKRRSVVVTPKAQDLKIRALLSIPRIGFNDHWGCIVDSLAPFGIPIMRYTTAFWGHGIQLGLEESLNDGMDWVLCLDYDSIFSKKHLDNLMGHFGRNPQIDALAPLQIGRNREAPLLTIKGKDRLSVSSKPIQADTAHFGMTLIRMDALADVPKPWFHGRPAPDGTWSDKRRIDDDIWFWKRWAAAGKSVFVATDVQIGHLECVVSVYDDKLEKTFITMDEWQDTHRPGTNRRGDV